MGKIKKSILVTGGSGFLGSHTADILTKQGYDVIIYDNKYSEYLNSNQKMLVGDINDYNKLKKATKNMHAIFHFAAEADIQKASQDPIEAVKVNILATTYLLELAVKHKIKKFIFGSSVYVNSNSGGIYTTTKQTCESLIKNFHDINKLNYVIFRYGSLYGTRSNKFNFINNLILNVFTKGQLIREGNGEEIRDYIFVEDAAIVTANSLKNELNNETVLVTGSQKIKIKDLLLLIREILNDKPKIKYINKNKLHHYIKTPYSFRPDTAKKYEINKKTELAEGLLATINSIYDQLKDTNVKIKL